VLGKQILLAQHRTSVLWTAREPVAARTVGLQAGRMTLDSRRLDDLLRWHQSGVVARRQVLELGGTDADIARMLRRHELTQAHPGVYVDHNGPLTPSQRLWVPVLARWPAALAQESALGENSNGPLHLAVDRDRHVDPLPGVEIHRVTDLRGRVDWRTMPPQMRVDEAVIDTMVARLDEDDVAEAFAVFARACFRRTNPERIARTLARRARVRHRRMITALVEDRRTGACSVLERGYLHRVERPHGLPRGNRQFRSTASGSATDQDVRYDEYGVVVELDGRTHYDSAASRDADAKRDLAELATAEALTARVTYGLVFGGQCATARWVGAVLAKRGWAGVLRQCPNCPT
jgi:hypothetical protein